MRKPRPPSRAIGRRRRAAGWTLLAFGLLTAAMWAVSAWCYIGWESAGGRWGFGFGRGLFGLALPPANGAGPGWSAEALGGAPPLHWWYPIYAGETGWTFGLFGQTTYSDGENDFDVVLWPIPLLLGAGAATLLRSGVVARRRTLSNACTKCGYSLAGLPSGSECPECGKRAATT